MGASSVNSVFREVCRFKVAGSLTQMSPSNELGHHSSNKRCDLGRADLPWLRV